MPEALRTVRVRTTLAATTVVALALLIAAGGLVWAVDRTLTGRVQNAAEARVEGVARLLVAGERPADVEVPPLDAEPVPVIVQVMDARGDVLFISPPHEAVQPVALAPGPTAADPVVVRAPMSWEDLAIADREVETPQGRFTVVAVSPLAEVARAVDTIVGVLQVGIPVLVALVAGIAWIMVGRALRPIEAMRAEAEAVSASTLHRRVPVPPGRDEVGRLARTLNRMLDRLEDSAARQRRFVSDASHELRSPVAAMRTEVEVALAHPAAADWDTVADTVLAETARLEGLVDDLLDLARGDEAVIRYGPVDLDAVVREEAARLRGVDVEVCGVAGVLPGDGTQLARLVRNLLENAARHADQAVAVTLSREPECAVVVIEDDGPGVPEADRQRIFERFARLEEARTRASGGAGLGLAVVRSIATAHGGTVTVGDARLGGARFEVRLPLHGR